MAINIFDGLSEKELELFDEIAWDSCFGINKEDENIVYDFNIGDKVKIVYKDMKEEDSKTLEGFCVDFYKAGIDSTFTIKKELINYIGRAKKFRLYLDMIQSIEIVEKHKINADNPLFRTKLRTNGFRARIKRNEWRIHQSLFRKRKQRR